MIALATSALLAPASAIDLCTAAEIGAPDVAPDGRSVVFVWSRLGDADLWLAPLPAGEPKALVAEPGDESDPHFSPDGRTVSYVGEGLEQRADIFVVDAGGGPPRNLSSHPAHDTAPRFSPDGRRLVFFSDRDGAGGDLYEIDLVSNQTRRLTRRAAPRDSQPAPDGVVLRATRGGRAELRWLPEKGRERRFGPRSLRPVGNVAWSADGQRAAVAAHAGDRLRIALVERQGRTTSWLASEEDADHRTPRISPAGDAIAFLRETSEATTLIVRPLDGRAAATISAPAGVVSEFAWLPDGSGLVYVREHATLPRSLFLGTLEAPASEPLVHAAPSLGEVPLHAFRRVTITRGAAIPPLSAWVAAPLPERAGRGVVFVHDGSTSMARDAYSPLIQFLVARRYAVVIPDLVPARLAGDERSTKAWAARQAQDVALAAGWLAREALAAPGRIAVVGEGRVGGYLALAAAASAPDGLRAVVSIGGAPDLGLLHAESPRRRTRREPSLPRDRLEAVMCVYGKEDPLLPPAQQFRQGLEKHGAAAPATIYEAEGSPLRGRRNRADALERIEHFLMTRL